MASAKGESESSFLLGVSPSLFSALDGLRRPPTVNLRYFRIATTDLAIFDWSLGSDYHEHSGGWRTRIEACTGRGGKRVALGGMLQGGM